jgi:signal transduction histidine kinase
MVRNSARHLLELINDVLDISKIEAGQLEVRAEPYRLVEAVGRVVDTVRPMAVRKGLSLDVHHPEALDAMVGDRRRTEQILLNLLNNAVKFTDKGSVTLTVAPAELPPAEGDGATAPRPAVCLRIADTGIGIKPADLANLFQPFRQVDTGLSRQHEGTGLGLAICRKLAELMGGSIVAASEWEKGSEFSVTLPLNAPANRTS